jgi:uncharacterized protein (TIGR02757 family)
VSPSRLAALKPALDRLYLDFDRVDSAADPVHIVRRYPDPADREVAGFCAAALAFGRVASVLGSIEALLEVVGPHPARYVRNFRMSRHASSLRPIVHRWTTGPDLAALILVLQHMLATAGSIEKFFLEGLADDAPDVRTALDTFSTRARKAAPRLPGSGPHGAGYFFPRPSTGSACKRLNLYLRWMIRRDTIDLGVWRSVPAAKLVMPLDTHVIRVSQCLGLTRHRSPGWAMAAEITESLRRIDPDDPVKYDFSLCHLGMMDLCGYGRNRRDRDPECPLRGLCRRRA